MRIPECIGIILDGNRRWARKNSLPPLEGHRRGYDRFVESARWARARGVTHMAAYAFSTENWNRSKEEVEYLMALFEEVAGEPLKKLTEENVRVRFIGKLDMLSRSLQERIREAERESAGNNEFTVWICLSYGSRAEITEAAKAAARGEAITEETLRGHMWSAGMPDPDIVIRPGGEKRLSNFLLWQAAYSEIFFLDVLWPDFSEADLDAVFEEYAKRDRRMGK